MISFNPTADMKVGRFDEAVMNSSRRAISTIDDPDF
jgi:hypothetical protein